MKLPLDVTLAASDLAKPLEEVSALAQAALKAKSYAPPGVHVSVRVHRWTVFANVIHVCWGGGGMVEMF